jgi:S-DNA-T family DNA segregation ATPase FtsK/SpoIIIE
MAPKRTRSQKAVLSRQEIAVRKRVLSDQQLQTHGAARRVIAGIFALALSLLTLLSLASFELRDGARGRYHNAIGPAGHVIASEVQQFLGICAYLLPLCGIYASLVLLIGSRAKRRWPQLAAGLLLTLSTAVLAQLALVGRPGWGAAPGGWLGESLADSLSALFSTAGTVIVLVAVSMVALIIGTQLGFLRVCALVWRASRIAAGWLASLALKFLQSQRTAFQLRREQAAKAKLENAAFLAQLEADEEELAQAERDALEAEEMAEAAVRFSKETEEGRGATGGKGSGGQLGAVLAPSREPAWVADFLGRTAAEPRSELSKRSERKLPQIVTPPGPAAALAAAALDPRRAAAGSEFPQAPSELAPPSVAAVAPAASTRTPLIIEPKAPPKPTKRKEQEQFEFVGDRRSFTPPPLDVLACDKTERSALDKDAFLSTADKLTAKLADFGIVGEVVEIRPGPVVTMYEFLPGPGIKLSKIASLADDLAMAMEAMRVRIVAPIPGKGVVGIEVPNRDRETVYLKEIAEQDVFTKSASKLTMCLGKDIEGMPYVLDLARAPHLLIAGTTGSGKSVAVNSMVMSILLKATPEEVRFIMVDPKMLELSSYEGIPHLLLPVVTDPKKAALALRWAVEEMERRYQILSEAGVRNIAGYNKLIESASGHARELLRSNEEKSKKPAPSAAPKKLLVVDVAQGETEDDALERAKSSESIGVAAPKEPAEEIREPIAAQEEAESSPYPADEALEAHDEEKKEVKKLPYIVVIIDELADLMMVAPREVETYVTRLAQMARASGIHLLVATQRPSTDVVTGVIKANFPTRISFMLRSRPDSMTILGTSGAEALLGMGDMLLMPPTSSNLERVHGAYVSEAEIKRAVDHLKAQGKPVYDDSILRPREGEMEGAGDDDLTDELYDQALAVISEMRQVSISMLQRKMRIGYNRSARMIERMEREGLVGPADGAKPREVLIRPVGELPGAEAMEG